MGPRGGPFPRLLLASRPPAWCGRPHPLVHPPAFPPARPLPLSLHSFPSGRLASPILPPPPCHLCLTTCLLWCSCRLPLATPLLLANQGLSWHLPLPLTGQWLSWQSPLLLAGHFFLWPLCHLHHLSSRLRSSQLPTQVSASHPNPHLFPPSLTYLPFPSTTHLPFFPFHYHLPTFLDPFWLGEPGAGKRGQDHQQQQVKLHLCHVGGL